MIRLARAGLVAALSATAPLASSSSAVRAQWTPEMVPEDSAAALAPFGPGEHLTYKVKVGWFGAGSAWMTLEGFEEVRGNLSYRAVMGIRGRFVVGLNDLYRTWFDVHTLQSWRFTRDMNQGSYSGTRDYAFFPERMMWERQDNDESGPLPTPLPLDDIAFVYFLRTLPLEVGRTYSFDRYFKETGNPVTVEVVRKDKRKTPAGEFDVIVVRPNFQSEGLFSEDGEAELEFSDDERRLLVYMWVDMPVVPGGVSLHLESVTEGIPVHPESRAAALRTARADTASR
jgi:hypothetical protein